LTVEEFYRQVLEQNKAAVDLAMDGDLRDMFVSRKPAPEEPAARRRVHA